MTPEQDALLRAVNGKLDNLLGQEGFVGGQWQGIPVNDGTGRKLTRLDQLREVHADLNEALRQLGRTGPGKTWKGWGQLGNLTIVDAVASIKKKLGA